MSVTSHFEYPSGFQNVLYNEQLPGDLQLEENEDLLYPVPIGMTVIQGRTTPTHDHAMRGSNKHQIYSLSSNPHVVSTLLKFQSIVITIH